MPAGGKKTGNRRPTVGKGAMGRPRKNQVEKPVRERIEDAFWELLRERSVGQISVSEIVRAVGCNRNTFYYHFDSVEDLTARAIDQAIPAEIPALAEAYFKGELSTMLLDERARQSIERLCLLMGKGASPALVEQVKAALKAVWMARFPVDCSQEDVACVLEFMASGVAGMLGYWGARSGEVSLDRCFQSVSSVFSKPAVAFAQEKGRALHVAGA